MKMNYPGPLIVINVLIALGLSAFLFEMLPFSHGVVNDARVLKGLTYRPLRPLEHYGTSLLPALIVGGFISGALLLRGKSPRLALALLVAPSLAVLMWVMSVFLRVPW